MGLTYVIMPKKYKKYKKSKIISKYNKYGPSAYNMARSAILIASATKKLLNVEYKFHDVQLTGVGLTETGTIVQLTNIAQGDTDQTRDGSQVKLTRLDIKYFLGSHVDQPLTQVRVMLIHDKQTNQAIYSLADLLVDSSTSDNIVSPLNLDNKYRFRILYNKIHSLTNSGSNHAINRKIHKELNMRIRYDASTAAIADITSSSLSLVLISNQPVNQPAITLFSRIRYIDN